MYFFPGNRVMHALTNNGSNYELQIIYYTRTAPQLCKVARYSTFSIGKSNIGII